MLGAGLGSLLVAMRLVGAAFSCSFSPFGYLPLPGDHGLRVLLLIGAAIAIGALLAVVLRSDDEGLWLPGVQGGVLVPTTQLQALLRDEALRHPDVAAADVVVRVRHGVPGASLDLALRPLAPADVVAAHVAAQARDRLARLTGMPEVEVATRQRVLSVSQLVRVLP